jgi:hypothetical protein
MSHTSAPIERNAICLAGGTQRIDYHRRVREGRDAVAAGDTIAIGTLTWRVSAAGGVEYRSDDGLTLNQQEERQGLPAPPRFSLEQYAEDIGISFAELRRHRQAARQNR